MLRCQRHFCPGKWGSSSSLRRHWISLVDLQLGWLTALCLAFILPGTDFSFIAVIAPNPFSLELFIPIWNSSASLSSFYISRAKKHGTPGLLRWKQFSLPHPYFSVRQNPSTKAEETKMLEEGTWEWGAQMTQTPKCKFLFSLSISVAAAPKHVALGLTFHNWHSWFHGLYMLLSFSQELPFSLWGHCGTMCPPPSSCLSLAVWLMLTRHSRFQQNALSETGFVSHRSDVHVFTACESINLLIFIFLGYLKATNNFSYWKIESVSWTIQSEPRQFWHPDLPSLFCEHSAPSLLLSFCLKCMSLKMHS